LLWVGGVRQTLAGSVGGSQVSPDSLQQSLGKVGARSSVQTPAISVAWRDESLDGFAGAAGSCTVVGVGALDRLDTLATELGRDLRNTSSGELVAEGYARWGSQLPERLHGRFAIVAWNGATDTALVAVDRLGAMAVFVAQRGGSLIFATEVESLLRLLDRQPAPDLTSVTQWLVSGTSPVGHTLYGGVTRLADAEAITVERGRVAHKRYWSLRYEDPLTGTRDELARHLRESISLAVAQGMPSAGGTAGIFLSGGLDSGTIAGFGVGLADERDVAMRGYCATFPDHPTMDESALVHELSAKLALPVKVLPVRATSVLAPALDYLQAWRLPSPSPNLHFRRVLTEAAEADGVRLVFDGEGGDELFALAPFYLADLIRRGRPDRAFVLARSFPGLGPSASGRQVWRHFRDFGLKGALPTTVRRFARWARPPTRHVPSWLNDAAGRAFVTTNDKWDWRERGDGPLWWQARVDDLVVARQRIGASDFLRRTAGRGMLDAHPFMDDLALTELVLRLPPAASFDADFDRPLLRAASAGHLPDSIRLRKDKTVFNPLFHDSLEGPDRKVIAALLGVRDARVNAYVRPEVVRSLVLEAPAEPRDGRRAWLAWRLIAIETWLRSLEDSSFPARAVEEFLLR
jgi:asparagine synthase (glutamine-hydrolysing)